MVRVQPGELLNPHRFAGSLFAGCVCAALSAQPENVRVNRPVDSHQRREREVGATFEIGDAVLGWEERARGADVHVADHRPNPSLSRSDARSRAIRERHSRYAKWLAEGHQRLRMGAVEGDENVRVRLDASGRTEALVLDPPPYAATRPHRSPGSLKGRPPTFAEPDFIRGGKDRLDHGALGAAASASHASRSGWDSYRYKGDSDEACSGAKPRNTMMLHGSRC